MQRIGEFLFLPALGQFNRDAVHGRRNGQRTQAQTVFVMTRMQHVVEADVLDLGDRADVARYGHGHFFQVLALETVDVRQLHALALLADIHQLAGLYLALMNTKRGQAAHIGVDVDLEYVSDEMSIRTRGVDLVRRRRIAVAGQEFRWVALQRTRHELCKHSQQLVQARAGQGRYETDRNQVTAPQRAFEGVVKLFQGDVFALQVLFHEVIVQFDDLIDNLGMGFLDGGEIGGRIGGLEETVGDSRAAVGRQIDREAAPAKGFDDLRQHAFKIRVRRVDLVDDDQPAEFVLGGGLHHPLGEQFDPRLAADYDRGCLRRRQCAEGAAHEVGVARAVQEVNEAAVVLQMRHRRVQRMPEPLLMIGEIADRRSLVNGTCGADGACLLQQSLDQGCLAGTGVSDNGDVSYLFGPVRCSHGRSFSSCGKRNL